MNKEFKFTEDEEKEDLEQTLCERLGFCGCGMPDDALSLINDIIQKYIGMPPYSRGFNGKEWREHCENKERILKKIIDENYDGVRYVLFYLLDDKKITFHGGSVPGEIEDKEFANKLSRYAAMIEK